MTGETGSPAERKISCGDTGVSDVGIGEVRLSQWSAGT